MFAALGSEPGGVFLLEQRDEQERLGDGLGLGEGCRERLRRGGRRSSREKLLEWICRVVVARRQPRWLGLGPRCGEESRRGRGVDEGTWAGERRETVQTIG